MTRTALATELFQLRFDPDGAELMSRAAAPLLNAIDRAVIGLPAERAGLRLHRIAGLDVVFARHGVLTGLATAALGQAAFPVRALLFDKTVATNWSLAWHQDRTIVVRRRADTPGFGPWTVKQGLIHVAPPVELLARMATLRVHLDPVPAGNAPLLIAPGSHRLGRVAEKDIVSVVRRRGVQACLAERGDVWVYATPILHASEAASTPAHRRVLQIDYAAEDLPDGLEWLGV